MNTPISIVVAGEEMLLSDWLYIRGTEWKASAWRGESNFGETLVLASRRITQLEADTQFLDRVTKQLIQLQDSVHSGLNQE